MSFIDIIRKEEIKKSLAEEKRQYLVGDLQLPQLLEYIPDQNVEAGITNYTEWTVEKPHYHTSTSEYIYMLEGESKYLDVKEKKEYHLKKGDFFIIRPDTVYAQKSVANTRLLFFKYPSGNDKVSVEDDTNDWADQW